jgi:NAD kinase
VPKAPILNSRRGHRCIPRPPEEVLEALANNKMIPNAYMKLECAVFTGHKKDSPDFQLTCLNEINVHMGRINSAVRFKIWINNEPFENGVEIVSDGFVVCTAFGSTAYFKAITKGIFTRGMGIAFKATTHSVNHLVLPQEAEVVFQITRGPATLAFDNSTGYVALERNDRLLIRRHSQNAIIMTCEPVTKLDEPF